MTKVLNRRLFNTGDVIFREGEEGSQAFVVQSGKIRIVRNLPNGEQGTLGFVEAGGIFGEMALIDRSNRMATAIAEAPAACIVITETVLRQKLKAADPALQMLLLMMIRLIRIVTDDTEVPPDALDELSEAAAWTEIDRTGDAVNEVQQEEPSS